MDNPPIVLTVSEHDSGQRLDRYIAQAQPELSRTYVQQLINDLHIRVNERDVKASYSVQAGDLVEIVLPLPQPTDILPQDLPLTVVFEDEDILVINKAAGMVVHPAPGHTQGTLVNALVHRYPKLVTSGDLRPGIVHRLDKETSGLMVVAKHDLARAFLVAQQQDRTMRKCYLALVEGSFKEPAGTIDEPIARHPQNRLRMAVVPNGRFARTHYRVQEQLGPYSLIEARLETGRTHQIRVHFAYKNRPVLGDALYGPKRPKESFNLQRHFLHAYKLGFYLPSDHAWHEWEAPLPSELATVLETLRRRYPPSPTTSYAESNLS